MYTCMYACMCVCAKYLIYSRQRSFANLLSLSVRLPLCHFSFLPLYLFFFSCPPSCCCLILQLLSRSAASAVFETTPSSTNITAMLILTGCISNCFWPLFLCLNVHLVSLSLVKSANNHQHAYSLCLCLRQSVIRGFLCWKLSSYLIYSCCIIGLFKISSPQRVAECSAEDLALFHHQPPVKMPLVKMLSKQSLWW